MKNKSIIKQVETFIFTIGWMFLLYYFIYNQIDEGTTVKTGYLLLLITAISIGSISINRKTTISKAAAIAGGMFIGFSAWIFFGSIISKYGYLAEDNIVNYVIFLMFIFFAAYGISYLRIFDLIVRVSYLEIICILFERFLKYKDYLSEVNIIASFNRVGSYTRVTFGFQHVNSCGNLCLLEIVLIILIINQLLEKRINKNIRNILIVINIGLLVFCTYILLLTSTRTAILSFLLLLALIIISLIFRTSDKRMKAILISLGLLVILLILTFIVINGMFSLDYFYTLTGRNNSLNIKLLSNLRSFIFGIGFVNPGLFGVNGLPGSYTTWMDNYYIYILVASGLIGFILNVGSIYYIGKQIGKQVRLHNEMHDTIFLCVYIVFCFGGLFETSVIYPHFAFSLVILPLSLNYCFFTR